MRRPQQLQDTPGMDVALTVEGALKADLEATNILAKMPQQRNAKREEKAGEKNPHLVPTPVGIRVAEPGA